MITLEERINRLFQNNSYKKNYHISSLIKNFKWTKFWLLDKYLRLKETNLELILIVSKKIIFGIIYTFITLLTMMIWHMFKSWKLALIIFLIWNTLLIFFLILEELNKRNYNLKLTNFNFEDEEEIF